jgi:hypothetical protein
MTKTEVVKELGVPQAHETPKVARSCWFSFWEPTKLSPIVGARICFDGGKVKFIQRSLPG